MEADQQTGGEKRAERAGLTASQGRSFNHQHNCKCGLATGPPISDVAASNRPFHSKLSAVATNISNAHPRTRSYPHTSDPTVFWADIHPPDQIRAVAQRAALSTGHCPHLGRPLRATAYSQHQPGLHYPTGLLWSSCPVSRAAIRFQARRHLTARNRH